MAEKRKTITFKEKIKLYFKKHRIFKIFLIFLIFTTLMGLIGVFALFQYNKKNLTTPVNPSTFYTAKNSTNVYDRNDNYIGSLSLNNIRWINLKNENGENLVSQDYLDGLIATEDKNFYNHHGVDYLGMIKAAISTVLTSNDRGGSSITMQTAKLVYMNDWTTYNEEGIDRRSQDKIGYKITQMLYAQEIEKVFKKEQILENYVNVVCFGDAGCGIKNASEYYYNKQPNELTLDESAVLAGMSQLPGVYNPYTNPEGTTERRNIVLKRMLDEKYIEKEEYDQAIAQPIDATLVKKENREVSKFKKYQGYLDVVYQEFLKLVDPNNDGQFDINVGGMDIYTNMDTNIQETLYDIINSNDPKYFQDEFIQTGAVIMDSQTGEVIAIGNGRGDHGGFFGTNFAYNYTRQPGSTAKPLVSIGPAIEYLNWSTAHPMNDQPISYDGQDGIQISNSDGKFEGEMTLRRSIARSRNTTALQAFKDVTNAVGLENVYNFVKNLGFTNINYKDFNQAYAIGGWQYGTTPYQLAGAYGTIANGGTYHTPHTINKVLVTPESPYYDKYGDKISPVIETRQAMKPETAFLLTDMLRTSQSDANGYVPKITNMDLSIKTGTSDWGENGKQYGIPNAAQRDKWVVGWNADLTVVTWTGYTQEYEKQGYYIDYNSSYEKNMFKAIIDSLSNRDNYLKDSNLNQPENVEMKKVSLANGKIVDNPNGETHYFIKDSSDTEILNNNKKPNQVQNLTGSVNEQEKKITLNWQYDNPTDGIIYRIYVDGNEIAQTKENSFTIDIETFVQKECKENYNVYVQAYNTKGSENQTGDPSSTITITIQNRDFCEVNQQEQQ